jgi:acetylornithine/N-succinyldiaminopimelate aminotransferase
MDYDEAVSTEKRCFAQVFNRLPILLTRGEGVYVFDDKGKRYLDLFAGIAVSCVGHAHPRVVDAIASQAARLIHSSNWVYTEPQLLLAEKITRLTGMERVFLTNDGTNAVETAIKLARKQTGRKGFIAMENSFHGRTLGALSATWTEKYRKPFEPLVPGFRFVKYDDPEALRKSVDEDTAAVIVEPIQGEAGVILPAPGYLKEVREITEKNGSLMIVDEVQTGFGRTGRWFEYQRAGVKPDIVCMAKGLGGGFPIGAAAYSGMDFEKGQQGGTFNGGPLACAAANAVIDVIEGEGLVENAARMGERILKGIRGGSAQGRGLIIGVDVDDGKKRALELIGKGAIAVFSGNRLRILPPLNLKREHADRIIGLINEVQ